MKEIYGMKESVKGTLREIFRPKWEKVPEDVIKQHNEELGEL
jgi:hypothetical protein